jgi:hypothetical protein
MGACSGCAGWWPCCTVNYRGGMHGCRRWRGEGKQDMAFSDAITPVRRWLWREWVLQSLGTSTLFKSPRPSRFLLLHALVPVA